MNNDVSAFVERYQLLYEKDPTSKVFAPLAEAYRRMGLLDEAIDLAKSGVALHPHFASGRVALGKCYAQKGELEKAIEHLKAAVDLSPENLLAHQILAECFVKIKKPADALNEFKMVLFLNPDDDKVAQIVRKLEEALYADQTLETHEDFSMERVSKVDLKSELQSESRAKIELAPETSPTTQPAADRDFERELALLDVRFDRGDWVTVGQQLSDLLRLHPGRPELVNRKKYLDDLLQNKFDQEDLLAPLKTDLHKLQVEKLQRLLERIEARRRA
jgi:tetratricopeptide (TPR) repeat protein